METGGLVVEDFYYKGASLQPPHFLCGAQVVCLEYWLYTISRKDFRRRVHVLNFLSLCCFH